MYTNYPKLSLVLSLTLLLVVGIVIGGIAQASGLINALNPEAVKPNVPAVVPPLLAPPSGEGYKPQAVMNKITASDGRPVAQLDSPPANLAQAISVNLPDRPGNRAIADSDVYYEVLSSIKYEGNGHVLLVTTARPSPAAAQQLTAFGDQTIQLTNGKTAWITMNLPGDVPNRVVFVEDDLIITVVSDLPIQEVQVLATQVI
ncbi:MAG: hypothetical protein ACREBU_26400, partial [Nitrososphaera sp.]